MVKQDRKQRVAVICGGRSGEHEISLRSAASVLKHLDRSRFEVYGIAIDKEGRWKAVHGFEPIESWISSVGESLEVNAQWPELRVPVTPGAPFCIPSAQHLSLTYDVLFPVMHGPLCEDGSIQGLFELLDAAYVGCAVMSSAVTMDKEMTKRILHAAQVPVVPWLTIYDANDSKLTERIKSTLGFPVFVKPANLGSSVGVHKVKTEENLLSALEDAFRYDSKVLIEKAISAREIEVAVLEDLKNPRTPKVSTVGEIVPQHEFYSYEAKYLDAEGALLKIPAELSQSQMSHVQSIARRAFQLLECEGMARVDLFLDQETNQFYFNEINTIPGFTSISMYPKLWEFSGLTYRQLLTELVELAIQRKQRRVRLVRDFHATQ